MSRAPRMAQKFSGVFGLMRYIFIVIQNAPFLTTSIPATIPIAPPPTWPASVLIAKLSLFLLPEQVVL
jgi:hypothetical protein